MELEKNRKESGGKNWILNNEKRVFQSCYPVVLRSPKAALQIDNTIWVGTYSGDRIGYFEKE